VLAFHPRATKTTKAIYGGGSSGGVVGDGSGQQQQLTEQEEDDGDEVLPIMITPPPLSQDLKPLLEVVAVLKQRQRIEQKRRREMGKEGKKKKSNKEEKAAAQEVEDEAAAMANVVAAAGSELKVAEAKADHGEGYCRSLLGAVGVKQPKKTRTAMDDVEGSDDDDDDDDDGGATDEKTPFVRPLMIVGMPRSGATLLQQMLVRECQHGRVRDYIYMSSPMPSFPTTMVATDQYHLPLSPPLHTHRYSHRHHPPSPLHAINNTTILRPSPIIQASHPNILLGDEYTAYMSALENAIQVRERS
jgi:hypothetical protein